MSPQAQLVELQTGTGEIAQRGFGLAGLSYDSIDVLSGFTNRRQITYALLSDPRSQVIDRYGLRDPQYPPGNRTHGVPRPVSFILDRQGTIKAKLFEESFTKQPPLGLVLETLDKPSPAR